MKPECGYGPEWLIGAYRGARDILTAGIYKSEPDGRRTPVIAGNNGIP